MTADHGALRSFVRDIADYPVAGVTFRDITPLLGDSAALAQAVDAKLPWAVVREEYNLEYGSDKLEIHRDAIHPGERILIVDDVLATGGTAAATAKLVETLGGVVAGLAFLLEIDDLGGRAKLGERTAQALLHY